MLSVFGFWFEGGMTKGEINVSTATLLYQVRTKPAVPSPCVYPRRVTAVL
jgi:hypothetical protein